MASAQGVQVLVAVQDGATGTAFVVTDSVTEASVVVLPAVLREMVVVELVVVGIVSVGAASEMEAGISAAVEKVALNMSMGYMIEGNQMLGAPGSPTNSNQILSPFFLLLMDTTDFEGTAGLDPPYPLVLGDIQLLGSPHMGEYNCSALDDS